MDEAGLDQAYREMYDAYSRVFTRCGLKFRPVLADSGQIGGGYTHEFMVLAENGEATIAYCDSCDFAANIEIAEAKPVACEDKHGHGGDRKDRDAKHRNHRRHLQLPRRYAREFHQEVC